MTQRVDNRGNPSWADEFPLMVAWVRSDAEQHGRRMPTTHAPSPAAGHDVGSSHLSGKDGRGRRLTADRHMQPRSGQRTIYGAAISAPACGMSGGAAMATRGCFGQPRCAPAVPGRWAFSLTGRSRCGDGSFSLRSMRRCPDRVSRYEGTPIEMAAVVIWKLTDGRWPAQEGLREDRGGAAS